ncbi:hypothetical protein AKJ41_03555 [candidate division MSBL1 archaeon SCGC-AAA259O05]|uniref:Restriction endonuclease type IV Mrr domain-containing protein n=1 Tax=candidate division MSBL1 archaeon SCGC-AAA259O05 TaxID=1698271 RepID=A0A133V3A8_9EURY|nr:hypothetical protein AKJ41_03555 [candidate division MSBL1 archaeon SCGC-AAA259O05]
MRSKIKKVANEINLSKNNLDRFLDESFRVVWEPEFEERYQRRAKKLGDAFEVVFDVTVDNLYPEVSSRMEKNVSLEEACMSGGGEADFVIFGDEFPRDIIAVIEAKGSAKKVEYEGRTIEVTDRPGIMRTDTIKKAISNAFQSKTAYPNSLFFIVTSHVPSSGNAKCMCDLAEGEIVDKIVNMKRGSDLQKMVKMVKEKI